jgi:hypothetical protein
MGNEFVEDTSWLDLAEIKQTDRRICGILYRYFYFIFGKNGEYEQMSCSSAYGGHPIYETWLKLTKQLE